ncbi:MAG: hypothetical protein HOV80_36860 [Polyangiaceae bacterium]|nr:hypothetical protein [Polyangiaceae bacterium]
MLVNEVSDGNGGGGNPDVTSTSSTPVTTGSTSSGGGGGGEPITCPGLAPIAVSRIETPADATFDDVVVRGDQVIYTARGTIDAMVAPGTTPGFLVYATPSLGTIDKRVLADDGAGGIIYAPIAAYDDENVIVHSSGVLTRVRNDSDPTAGDDTPSRLLKFLEADEGKLYGIEDGLGGVLVAMSIGMQPFSIEMEQVLYSQLQSTYAQSFDVEGGILLWAESGPGGPKLCTAAGCQPPIEVDAPPNVFQIAIGAGRGFAVAPKRGDMAPYSVWGFDFLGAPAQPVFSVATTSTDQGVQAVTIVEKTAAFVRRPDTPPTELELVRCCADGALADLDDALCTSPASISGTGSSTVRKMVAGPGPNAVTMLMDRSGGGQSIVVASWQPSP